MRSTENTNENKMSVKEKILYTLVGVGGVVGLTWWGAHKIKKRTENKAQAKSFNDGSPQTIAKQMQMALNIAGWLPADTGEIRTILTNIKSKTELKSVFDEFTNEFHRNMYQDMSTALNLSEYNEMLQIINGKPVTAGGQVPYLAQYNAWAKRLKEAFNKKYGFIKGTDEDAIKAVFNEIPTQTAFINVGKAYHTLYNANLITDLHSELEFYEYPDYMKIITSKKK